MNSVSSTHPDFTSNMDPDSELNGLLLLTLRTIDPPARQLAAATGEGDTQESDVEGIWKARRGGMKRKTITKMVRMVLDRGGVGEDVFKGLEGWF